MVQATSKSLKLYVIPRGRHFHTSLNCPMLQDLGCRRLYWGEVAKRGLVPCICAGRTGEQRAEVVRELKKRGRIADEVH